MDKQTHRIINELMMLVGFAMGALEGLTHWDVETHMEMTAKAQNALARLEKATDRILIELNKEIDK